MNNPVIDNTALKVVDVDTHWSEPHDLWQKRAPAGSLRDRLPQVKTIDGKFSWYIDGDKPIGGNGRAVSSTYKNGQKGMGNAWETIKLEESHEGAWDTKARLKYMDESGIWAQIVYPNLLGFGGNKAVNVDKELRTAAIKIYNDACADMQRESNGRICGMALLPWWDVKESVKEIERCHAMGMHGVNINSDPQSTKLTDVGKLPDLSSPHWDPLWEVITDKNIPVNFHVGASEGALDFYGNAPWPSMTPPMKMVSGSTMLFFNNARIIGNMILSGMLDRWEKLQFVSVESGIGWVPFVLEGLDYQYAHFTDAKALKGIPSDYFRRNFYATFWFEGPRLAQDVRDIGIDRVMFETDFPHPTCLYPVPNLNSTLSSLTLEEQKKVLSTNAAKLYKINL